MYNIRCLLCVQVEVLVTTSQGGIYAKISLLNVRFSLSLTILRC